MFLAIHPSCFISIFDKLICGKLISGCVGEGTHMIVKNIMANITNLFLIVNNMISFHCSILQFVSVTECFGYCTQQSQLQVITCSIACATEIDAGSNTLDV